MTVSRAAMIGAFGRPPAGGGPGAWWAGVALAAALLVALAQAPLLAWLATYPEAWQPPIAAGINQAMGWFVDTFRWLFRAIESGLRLPMTAAEWLLQGLPWVAIVGVVALAAHAARGWKLALAVVAAMLYVAASGYWVPTMNTLTLVVVAVPLSVGAGFGLGVLAHYRPRFRAVLMPVIDVMQTVPTFAYLIPLLVLFGFGPVVGLMGSAIYAMPPMVRNVVLGLDRVPREQIEVGQISGAARGQQFWWIAFPSALRTIMMGVNQTIMAVLSMVIIASVVGGSNDIGWIVLDNMNRASPGPSLLAGMVIVLIAMVTERISRGFSETGVGARPAGAVAWWRRFPHALAAVLLVAAAVPLSWWWPALAEFPATLQLSRFGQDIDAFVNGIVRDYSSQFSMLKAAIQYYLLLPLRIGLTDAVNPMTWGMEMSPAITWGFALAAAGGAVALWRAAGLAALVAFAFYAVLFYFGARDVPWSVITLFIAAACWRVAGPRLALFALGVCLFFVLSGVWDRAMLTFVIISVAVGIAFPMGAALGVLAARHAAVSAVLRPINDTLQTLPPFVYLIPAVMLFQVGTFTALVAVIAYCIVPAIRYTEHGLRHVDPEVIEAARSMGTTRWQLLRDAELPLARPAILLGLNQTVMMALAMLVIAALVGTRGLGQYVYEGMTHADMGIGVIAGGGIALMAILCSRLIDAAASRAAPQTT